MNLAFWLDRAGKAYPDRPAVALGAHVFADYGALAGRAARIAASLRSTFGLCSGDRVGIVAKNCAEYVEVLYGIWWAGLVAVPVNAKLHGAEIAWILENCNASLAFATPGLDVTLNVHRPDCLATVVAIESPEYRAALEATPASLAAVAPGDLAWLFYTSGTTGRPKGAMLSHRNIMAMSHGYLLDVDPTAPGQPVLHAAPMSHGSGMYIVPHICRMGVNVVPESGGFDPVEIFELAETHRQMSMFGAPTMIKRMVDCSRDVDPAVFRTLVWGGAPMHVADVKNAFQRFGGCLAQIYGQGETPMTATVLSKEDIADTAHPDWEARLGTAGIANALTEVTIGGPNDETLPLGETGEVLVRGDSVMLGYWNNPEATADALRGGWLRMGDVGAMDEAGYLMLKDRSKDMIISGGANIYPREVEEALLTHPGVKEVSVIGRPDPDWGEIVVAYVVGETTAQELDNICVETIARFKRPKDYIFLDALPKNNYGKILKTELRERDAEHGPKSSGA